MERLVRIFLNGAKNGHGSAKELADDIRYALGGRRIPHIDEEGAYVGGASKSLPQQQAALSQMFGYPVKLESRGRDRTAYGEYRNVYTLETATAKAIIEL